MEVVDFPISLPGSCRTCGGAEKEWYLDMGYSEDFFGAIYYCCDCIAAMSQLCGFETPKNVQKLYDELEIVKEELFMERVNRENLEKVVDGLSASRLSGGVSSVPDSASPHGEASFEFGEQEQGEGDDVGGGEGTPPESLHGEGVGNVHSDDDSNDSGFKLNLT